MDREFAMSLQSSHDDREPGTLSAADQGGSYRDSTYDSTQHTSTDTSSTVDSPAYPWHMHSPVRAGGRSRQGLLYFYLDW